MVQKVTKFSRGTVWWCKDPQLHRDDTSVQRGKRPALIVSNNDRGNSQVVEVVKLTTKPKGDYPKINVPIFYNGAVNYILCNQHFTVSLDDLEDFMFAVPASTMSEVESAMLYCLGMEHLMEVQKDYMMMKNLMKKLVDECKASFDVDKLVSADKILNDTKNSIRDLIDWTRSNINEVREMKKEDKKPEVDTKDSNVSNTPPSPPTSGSNIVRPNDNPPVQIKRGRGFWTEDKMREFMNDKDKFRMDYVLKKWGMTSSATAYTYYSQFKNKLKKMKEDEKAQ